MAIFRAPRPETNYTQVRNDVLRDERLSYRARGVLAVILSRPDNWSASAESLSRDGQEGRDAIRTALGELESAGYLKREKRQDDRGRWATQAVVYDTPQAVPVQMAIPLSGATDDGFPGVGKPAVGFPGPIRTPDKNTLPTEGATAAPHAAEVKAEAPADRIARAVYDAAQGMVKYLAVRTVAAKGLKVAGATEENVQAALLALYAENRPLTLETLGQRLQRSTGGRMADTHDSHWASGGSFTQEGR
jgi:hypothetical protein